MLSQGKVLGSRYRIVKRIGGGGMKQVYLAEDQRLHNRPCAIAEITDQLSDPREKQTAADAFNREAQTLACLNHDRIVRIYDRLSEINHHYLVMEYVEGETLEHLLGSPPEPLDEKLVVQHAIAILEALQYLHGQKPPIVYRDLKPANVIITPEGRVKLIDFGTARVFVPKKTGTTLGTPGY